MHADKNKSSDTIGVIPIDSIFSPVRKVSYVIGLAQVGQRTDFDSLVIDVETDGSVTPSEAMSSAGETLANLFELISEMDDYEGLVPDELAPVEPSGQEHLDLPIEALDLSERPRNCLRRAQVQSVGELIEKTEEDLLNITNFGQKSLEEVVAKLDELGFSLKNYADVDASMV